MTVIDHGALSRNVSGEPGTGASRRLRIARRRPGEAHARIQEYVVAADQETTLLEALREIRSHHDRSLTLRYSCCHASCGTCGMRMNGREVLACVTRLAEAGPGPILVEPLANARVEHDLVVDMRDFYDGLEPAHRPLIRHDDRLAGPDPDEAVLPFARFEDCIECGLCVSACPIAGSDSRYVGPAALAAAWRSVAEPRGADTGQVLAWADDEQGCWRCHASFECTEACPSAADPAGAIMALRGELTKRKLGRIARLGRRAR
jgi:succinate dehydrogenase / fumarate reductase iron-sulfur subunit